MTPWLITFILVAYFSVLIVVSIITGRKSDNRTFFTGNKNTPWYMVAFGMIGTSISGVTFISVPGWVGSSQFSYMQMVLGYLVGYIVVANVLLPLYYRLNLTSIYTYLQQRFGNTTYKTGAFFFLFSRLIGSAFRLFLMAHVLQFTMFDAWHVPFWVTVFVTIGLIWLYTNRGGIKTVIYTDSLQTVFMLASVVLSFYFISQALNLSAIQAFKAIWQSDMSRIFVFDTIKVPHHFIKQFLGGAFITIVMTGLDQDMMQKNLTCRSLKDAQKNMYWYSAAFVPINLLFLSLGALLYLYVAQTGMAMPPKADNLFPMIATQSHLPLIVGICFILGLIAAAYSSADSALTALTTSFTIDILNIEQQNWPAKKQVRIRKWSHLGISILTGVVIIVFNSFHNESIISSIFKVAGYTYGPLLGLYAFGLYTKKQVHDKWVWLIALLSPIISILLNFYSEKLFFGYTFGFEILIVNGLLTFIGLLLIQKKVTPYATN